MFISFIASFDTSNKVLLHFTLNLYKCLAQTWILLSKKSKSIFLFFLLYGMFACLRETERQREKGKWEYTPLHTHMHSWGGVWMHSNSFSFILLSGFLGTYTHTIGIFVKLQVWYSNYAVVHVRSSDLTTMPLVGPKK